LPCSQIPQQGSLNGKRKAIRVRRNFSSKEKKDAAGNALETKKSIVVTDVTRVLATSDKEVGMLAAKSIPDEYSDKLDDVEIVIRPF
jgi:hypothetical protein